MEQQTNGRFFGAVCISTLISGFLMLLLTFLAAAVVYLSPWDESVLPMLSGVLRTAILLAAGCIAGKRAGQRGLFAGAITGGILLLLMAFLGPEGYAPARDGLGLLAAAIGGVIGVR